MEAFKDLSLLAELESGRDVTEPDVAVRREGNEVTVTYTVPSENEGLWSAELLIMTHQGDERAPVERVYLVNGADEGLAAEQPETTSTS